MNDPQHRPIHDVRKFPRGQFGMPIIFHFQSKHDPTNPDPTLTPENMERLASPLILRPYRSPDGKTSQALAVVLTDPSRKDLPTVLRHKKETKVALKLTPEEANWKNSPLNGEADPLVAFLNSLG